MALRMAKEHLFMKRHSATEPLDGRVVIITGSNTGLGYHAAIHLAKLNPAKLILAVRNIEKGNKAAEGIKQAANFNGDLQVWHIDMSSFKSVAAFIDKVNNELDRLDIFLANAALATFKFKKTEDGHEELFQVNTLSTGLLALGVLPKLADTANRPTSGPSASFKPHLTIVGSDAHFLAKYNERKTSGRIIDALNDEKQFGGIDRYNVTKVLTYFATRKISQLPLAQNVVVNNVNPGLCVSELRREMGGITGKLLDSIALSGEEGSKNLAWAATADTSSTPGCYVSSTRVTDPSPFVRSKEGLMNEEKVWREMTDVWKAAAPAQVKAVLSA